MTEMVGIAIARRAWPGGGPTYVDAISARRVMEKKTEQEVNLAEILNASRSPNPPSDYADRWSGS